ncbi:MAG: ferrochelatase [Alphaproteobacteria bacterium]|nr:ferrochelatase [Alphaproteobacteria bacterium]MBU1514985.1 ferrochelatase [Alphaproteobacteria bacterium]MBU2095634.1 ferrochelatase [Alphaproteobacteria bacterium]MBU2152424.1 ferrochelatase [Alphaproteobacteria bacterium]MBU2306925.1 ferrochelatase [Alphaproteobacteria bacterium]
MKLAVVLFNLGGPDSLKAVRPFLFNLFRDPAIIQLPAPARYALAALISTTRNKTAQANYAIMGGRSPLLPETETQAAALEAVLKSQGHDARVFIAMRYWHPFADETAKQVAAYAPDEIVLLPLYPQFSTTTTGSSVKDWTKVYKGPGRTRTVCCYPTASGLAQAHAAEIRKVWDAAGRPANVRLLFSAHGLPQQIVDAGDPYEAQINATAATVAALLPELSDWRVSFQSRVGRLQWLKPSTEDAIRAARDDGKGVLVSPIAFVSEHVETLVELDHEYADLAKELGVAPYLRARTPGVGATFIGDLATAVTQALPRDGVASFGPWLCPAAHGKCPHRHEAAA